MIETAITRKPGFDFSQGLTTTCGPPPVRDQVVSQHEAYVDTLMSLGLAVLELPEAPGFPDACFIEDAAVVLAELAVVTRPGAVSRRGETEAVRSALEPFRPLAVIEPPGTLEGGDVLVAGRTVFIGISSRTNPDGAGQLEAHLAPLGYRCRRVPVARGLHLKSCLSLVSNDTLIMAGAYSHRPEFRHFRRITPIPEDMEACNCLRINDTLLMPRGFPRVRDLLVNLDLPLMEVTISEFQKMDGGLTCLSLRF